MDNHILISTIVPLYQGTGYLFDIIERIEAAARKIEGKIQLILVNDYPDEQLPTDLFSSEIEINVFNTEKNRGIHGARVFGLTFAEGEYILFLDQDDVIAEDYFQSQLLCMEDKDVSVCQCIEEGRLFYNQSYQMDEVVTYEELIGTGCSIVSPGQVLIRKSSIPNAWKEHIMMSNCADDYFLWILMFSKGVRVALNKDILFEHTVNGCNLSHDYIKLYESEHELLGFLEQYRLIPDDDVLRFKNRMNMMFVRNIQRLQSFENKCWIMYSLQVLKKNGKLESFFHQKGWNKIAIYGAGMVGQSILFAVENFCHVTQFIDRSAECINVEGCETVILEDACKEVDAVIVSLTYGYEDVMKQLKKNFDTHILLIQDLIREIEKV